MVQLYRTFGLATINAAKIRLVFSNLLNYGRHSLYSEMPERRSFLLRCIRQTVPSGPSFLKAMLLNMQWDCF